MHMETFGLSSLGNYTPVPLGYNHLIVHLENILITLYVTSAHPFLLGLPQIAFIYIHCSFIL